MPIYKPNINLNTNNVGIPITILESEVLVIPDNYRMMYSSEINIEGIIEINGILEEIN